MKIVTVTKEIQVEYLVNTDNKATALKTVKTLDGTDVEFIEFPGWAEISCTDYKARDLIAKEKEDFMVKRAQQHWASDDVEPEPVRKRKKATRKKAAKRQDEDAALDVLLATGD